VRETKKTRIDGVHEERAGRRDVVKASCLASWRGAHRPSEAPPSSPLGVRSLWPCAVRTLPQGWRVHNGGTAHAPCPSAGGCLARCHESVGGCIRKEYTARGKGHHGRRATPATVRGEPGGVRTPEAPGGVSSFYPRVPRLPPRDRLALAILRPLRDTVGHALPRLRQPVATARCAGLPSVWCGLTTGPALRPRRGCQALLGLFL
jgi:hypothetical protein